MNKMSAALNRNRKAGRKAGVQRNPTQLENAANPKAINPADR
jgi:hypothetical protein